MCGCALGNTTHCNAPALLQPSWVALGKFPSWPTSRGVERVKPLLSDDGAGLATRIARHPPPELPLSAKKSQRNGAAWSESSFDEFLVLLQRRTVMLPEPVGLGVDSGAPAGGGAACLGDGVRVAKAEEALEQPP